MIFFIFYINTEIELLDELINKTNNLINKKKEINDIFKNITYDLKEISLFLEEINISHTKEFLNKEFFINLRSYINKNYLTNYEFIINSPSPFLIFKSKYPTFTRKLIIKSNYNLTCQPKQIILEFFNNSNLTFQTKSIFLTLNFFNDFILDFKTEIYFTKVLIKVLRNWGNPGKTCFPFIKLMKPILFT